MPRDQLAYSPEAQEIREKKRFIVAQKTVASRKHPERNEDSGFIDGENGLLALSDGSAFSEKGALASGLAVAYIESSASELFNDREGVPLTDVDVLSARMDQVFRETATYVKENGGGGTGTLIMAKTIETPTGTKAIVKSVGDSLGWTLSPAGELRPIPIESDSWLQEGVNNDEFTAEEAEAISEASSLEDFVDQLVHIGKIPEGRRNEAVDLFAELRSQFKLTSGKLGTDAALADRDAFLANQTIKNPEIVAAAKLLRPFEQYYLSGQAKRNQITQTLTDGDPTALRIHSALIDLPPGAVLILASDGMENLTRQEIEGILNGPGTLQERLARAKNQAYEKSAHRPNEKSVRNKIDDIMISALESPGGPERTFSPRELANYAAQERQIEKEMARRETQQLEKAQQDVAKLKIKLQAAAPGPTTSEPIFELNDTGTGLEDVIPVSDELHEEPPAPKKLVDRIREWFRR